MNISSTYEDFNEGQGLQIDEQKISSWERWMIHKTIQDRQRQREAMEAKMERRRKEAELRRKETERRFKANDCHRKWLNEKSQQIKQKKNNERRKKEEQQMEEKMKRKTREEIVKENYQKWCRMKDEEKQKQKQITLEREQIKAKEQRRRQYQAEQAYQDWLHKTSHSNKNGYRWWRKGNAIDSCPNHPWIGPMDMEPNNANQSQSVLDITITK